MRRRFRPGESVRVLRPDRDEHDARAQLRHAEIRSVKQAPVCHVAELRESAADVGAIDFKDRVEHAAHILKHYGAGPGLIDDIDGGGKQVPVVICAELLESGRFRAFSAEALRFQESQQVGVNGIGLGCGHAVRKALVGFQCAIL